MSQFSLSPALVANFGSAITTPRTDAFTPQIYQFNTVAPYTDGYGYMFVGGTITFLNSAQVGLISYSMVTSDVSRSTDANGYVVWSNFLTKTPAGSGTIEFVKLDAVYNRFSILLTVGDTGSGADVEIADRTITTAQPWSLTGSIKLRFPMSYTYTL